MSLKYKNLNNCEKDLKVRFRSETLKSLADQTTDSLRLLSDLKADLNHAHSYSPMVKKPVKKLIEDSLLMAQTLNLINNNKHQALYNAIYRIKTGTDEVFKKNEDNNFPTAIDFDNKLSLNPLASGSKVYWIAKLKSVFKENVPSGFVVTTKGYNTFLNQLGLNEKIKLLCSDPRDLNNQNKAQEISARVNGLIQNSKLPTQLENEIVNSAKKIAGNKNIKWAVRASVADENGDQSFAGQSINLVNVETDDLAKAYKKVVSGKFSYQSIMYRTIRGLREVQTPVAVLFMPMISIKIKGNVRTADINNPKKKFIIINHFSKESKQHRRSVFLPLKSQASLLSKDSKKEKLSTEMSRVLEKIALMAQKAKTLIGSDLDLEWGMDKNGKVFFLQCKKLQIRKKEVVHSPGKMDTNLIAHGGRTLFPGRADGNITILRSRNDLENVKPGSIILIDKARDFLVPVLPLASAVIILDSDPFNPILNLIKDLSIPAIYQLGEDGKKLFDKNLVSMDATKRKIYNGIRWPGIRDRVHSRIKNRTKAKGESPLYQYILNLNLKSPDSPTFKAKLCGSVHDVIWYIQEMSLRAIFEFGDQQKNTKYSKNIKLKTNLPLNLKVIDTDLSSGISEKLSLPENINSELFKSLWSGLSDPDLFWPMRWEKKMVDMPVEFSEVVLGGTKGPRRRNDNNYVMIGKNYLNLSARISYHYTMVDAVISPGLEKNHIHFRFWDGGGNFESRVYCARFLERVLLHHGFGVERKGDVINSWYRFYPKEDTMDKLKMIGRLIVCARELDAVLNTKTDAKLYSDYFIEGNYQIFS